MIRLPLVRSSMTKLALMSTSQWSCLAELALMSTPKCSGLSKLALLSTMSTEAPHYQATRIHLSIPGSSNFEGGAQGGGGLQLFQAEMCHPEQLVSRVVVIVKDLKLEPQFLFMRAHLSVI